jgi:hypothetical protein
MTADSGYKGSMRTAVTAVAIYALLLVGGCGMMEQNKPEEQVDADLTADDLGTGDFSADDDIIKMLPAEQREALEQSGMIRPAKHADAADGDGADDGDLGADHDGDSTSKKVGGTMMSILAVGFSLGIMAAPYLLF